MAWTDQCRISANQTIDKTVENMGISVSKSFMVVSKETDIPVGTLKRWYYPQKESCLKNGTTRPKSQKAHWNIVERKLNSTVEYMMENCRNKEGNLTSETASKIINHIRHLTIIQGHFLEGIENAES